MTNAMDAEQLRAMFLSVARKVVDSEDFLTEIDIKIGDGDHGIGMATGFKSVLKELPHANLQSAEDAFCEVGNLLLDTMGGASGVLFGTMFISGIVTRAKAETVSLRGFAEIFRTSLDALKRRGKAKVGDKTMVDAFEPAVVALEHAADNETSLCQGLAQAANAAKTGMEYTKQCVARFGRAKSYGKASIGLQDAGATSVWIIFQAMADWADTNVPKQRKDPT